MQLIEAATETHVWAEIYDRKLDDVFGVEGEVASAIAEALNAKVTGSEKQAITVRVTQSSEAYDAYLRGLALYRKAVRPDRSAQQFLAQAVRLDPGFAAAWALLAQSHAYFFFNLDATEERRGAARSALATALRLQPDLAEVQLAQGYYQYWVEHDYAGARRDFEQLLAKWPNNAEILTAIGRIARRQGRWAQSNIAGEVAQMQRAAALDPLSLIINTNLGRALIDARRFDEAIVQLHKTIEMDASFSYAHRMLGLALELQGKSAEAIAEYEKAISLGENVPAPAMLGHLYGTLGRKQEATKILRQLQAESERRYVDPFWLAIVYVGLGDREHALAALEQGFAGRNGDELSFIRIDSFFDPLRADPRFEALAEKIVPAREFAKTSPSAK